LSSQIPVAGGGDPRSGGEPCELVPRGAGEPEDIPELKPKRGTSRNLEKNLFLSQPVRSNTAA